MKPTAIRIALRSLLSLAIGGASGAMVNVLEDAGNLKKMDPHDLLLHALYGAILAIAVHYAPPPTSPTSPPKP